MTTHRGRCRGLPAYGTVSFTALSLDSGMVTRGVLRCDPHPLQSMGSYHYERKYMDPQKLENLQKTGWKDVTIAELISQLSGLPPMMEVFVNADGESMFLNSVQVEQVDDARTPPFLRLHASVTPAAKLPPSTESVEEQTARQAQRAMDLSAVADESTRMPRIVE